MSVALVGEPVGVGTLDGAVALLAVTPEPLELGLVVGGPVGSCGGHLAAGQCLGESVCAGAGVRRGDAPAGFVGDDVHGRGEVGFGVSGRNQIIVGPLLHFAGRYRGADRRRGRRR